MKNKKMKASRNKKQCVITERKAKEILLNELKWKQLHTAEFMPGKVQLTGLCTLQYYDKEPLFYEIGFKLQTTKPTKEKNYSARINCHTGYIEGIEERPKGFTGSERPPIKIIMSVEDMLRKRYLNKKKITLSETEA